MTERCDRQPHIMEARDSTCTAGYAALMQSGVIESDARQMVLVSQLDALRERLEIHQPVCRKKGLLGLLLGPAVPAATPRGLYIWGAVGRGKTMLMDLFYESLVGPAKRRIHFHAFMDDVHRRIHAHRQALKGGEARGDDPVPPVASALAENAQVLCFDEFDINDIADAVILRRLFTALFKSGVVVVATSNVEPDHLYKGGLNSNAILPFITLLHERMDVVHLDARTDFRLEKKPGATVYYWPANVGTRAAIDNAFQQLTGRARGEPTTLMNNNHPILVPQAASGVARFGFPDLCGQPLGAADYIALARAFNTIIVEDVPAMSHEQRNEAKRFIMLVDVLYEAKAMLILSAEIDASSLYHAGEGHEVLEFRRTASRLAEMCSQEYLSTVRRAPPCLGKPDAVLVRDS